MTENPALTALIDQAASIVRDYAVDAGVNLRDPKISRAIQLTMDEMLYQAQLAEPVDRLVANSFYVYAQAWRLATR